MDTYSCTKCGHLQPWKAWSDKDEIPLKCGNCGKLTLHKRVKEPLVQKDNPVGG